MEKSVGTVYLYEFKYKIEVKRFADGIINVTVRHDDMLDHTDVYGYKFNFDLIPNFREMSVKDIRKSIEQHFINYLTSLTE